MHFDRAMALLLEGYDVQRTAWVGEERNKYLTQLTDSEGNKLVVAQGVEYVFARPRPFTATAVVLGADLSADDWVALPRHNAVRLSSVGHGPTEWGS